MDKDVHTLRVFMVSLFTRERHLIYEAMNLVEPNSNRDQTIKYYSYKAFGEKDESYYNGEKFDQYFMPELTYEDVEQEAKIIGYKPNKPKYPFHAKSVLPLSMGD
jgi:hypothetical protein